MIRGILSLLRHHPREYPIDHPIRESRELVTASNLQREMSERLIKRVVDTIKADEIAPMPRVWEDGGGR